MADKLRGTLADLGSIKGTLADGAIITGRLYVPEIITPPIYSGPVTITPTRQAQTLETGGTATYTHSISYGIYPSPTAATFSNSTSNTPTVTVKTPAINARCNSTYFAVARAAELDQAASKFRLVGKVYRVEKEDAVEAMYREFYERFNAEQ